MLGYIEYFNGDVERAEMEVEMIFEKLDFNQNGSIDYTEFMIANIDKDRLLQEDLLYDAFKMFDIDGSGSI